MSTTPRRLGKYELHKLLGHGSAGEVWKGYDLQQRQDVAIKLLHPDLLQSDPNFINSFMKEWQFIIALHHPNIVRVREVNMTRPNETRVTTPYIVMDYIEGYTTLTNFIQQSSRIGKFPAVADIVHLFASLGAVVDYAHEQNIVHNNIKPSNILLDLRNTRHSSSGEPMLTDFGIGNLPGNEAYASPLYMSPEQVKSQPPNSRSDIYALGVILYEMCTGVLPFHGESNVAIMMHHINTLPTPPTLINPHISPDLSEVILRAMAKDPHTRFATAALLASALAEACAIGHDGNFTLHSIRPTADEARFSLSSGPLSHSASQVPPPSTTHMAPILGVAQPVSTMPTKFPTQEPGTVLTPAEERAAMQHTASTGQIRPVPGDFPLPWNSSAPRQSQGTEPLHTPPLIPATKPPMPLAASGPEVGQRRKARASAFLSPLALIIICLLLLLVIGGSLAASLLLRSAAVAPPKTVVGHVFFQDDALGRDDTLHIEMGNLPTPPTGKHYYAWLQPKTGQDLSLGPLVLQNGAAVLLYTGDANHSNLLATVQAVIITLENTGQHQPTTLSNNAKVYQASVSTAALPYIQHILYTLPGFPVNGGLSAGLFDTMQGLNDKAASIVDSMRGNAADALAVRQATRIIELIDGTQFARSSGDLPQTLPDMLTLPVGLLSSPSQQGYIDALAAQVDKVKQVAGDDTALLHHAQNVSNALTDLRSWVAQLRSYDVQILQATNLSDPAIINVALQLKQLAQVAYTGRTVPPNDSPQPILGSAGAYQAYVESQYMATLDIRKV